MTRILTVLASVSCLKDFGGGGNLCTLEFTLDQLHELAGFAVLLDIQGWFCAEKRSEYNLRVYDEYHLDLLTSPYVLADDRVKNLEAEEVPKPLRVDIPYLRVDKNGNLTMTWIPRHSDESELCTACLPNVQDLILEFKRAFPVEVPCG